MSTGKKKQPRATAIVEQGGRVLLVREKGHNQFSLPGGRIEGRESAMEAALREIREETRLRPVKAERLFNHEGEVVVHRVVRVETQGSVKLQWKELSGHKWWDWKQQVAMLPSAKAILDRYKSHYG